MNGETGNNGKPDKNKFFKKKHVKKAGGGAPGFVIYHTNYSLLADPKKLPKEAD